MSQLVLGLCIFFAAHTFTMFRTARQRIVDRIGTLPYRGLYSIVALTGFVLIVTGYGDAPRIEIWAPPGWMRSVALALMLPALIILVAAYLPGHIKARLKNPMLIALKTWAFAHLLVNGDLASILLFGAFLTWAVVDLIAVKRSGRGALVSAPNVMFDIAAIGIGTAIYAGILFVAHAWITGIPLVAG